MDKGTYVGFFTLVMLAVFLLSTASSTILAEGCTASCAFTSCSATDCRAGSHASCGCFIGLASCGCVPDRSWPSAELFVPVEESVTGAGQIQMRFEDATLEINDQVVARGLSAAGEAIGLYVRDKGRYTIASVPFTGSAPVGALEERTLSFSIDGDTIKLTSKNNVLEGLQEMWVRHDADFAPGDVDFAIGGLEFLRDVQ